MQTKIYLEYTRQQVGSTMLLVQVEYCCMWILLAARSLCSVSDFLLVNWPMMVPDLFCTQHHKESHPPQEEHNYAVESLQPCLRGWPQHHALGRSEKVIFFPFARDYADTDGSHLLVLPKALIG